MRTRIVRNDELMRYEMPVEGGLAIAAFEQAGDAVLFTHTETPPAARGRGAASELVARALDDVRSRGLKASPLCSFVRRYMREHPETHDLLTP